MTIKKITRTIEFTFEQSERIFLNSRAVVARFWCPRCGRAENFAAPAEIARRSGIKQRRIFRFIESGAVGFQELSEGVLMVCAECVNRYRNGK